MEPSVGVDLYCVTSCYPCLKKSFPFLLSMQFCLLALMACVNLWVLMSGWLAAPFFVFLNYCQYQRQAYVAYRQRIWKSFHILIYYCYYRLSLVSVNHHKGLPLESREVQLEVATAKLYPWMSSTMSSIYYK